MLRNVKYVSQQITRIVLVSFQYHDIHLYRTTRTSTLLVKNGSKKEFPVQMNVDVKHILYVNLS